MRPYPLECDALVGDLLVDLDGLTEEVEGRFGHLTDEQLAWQPSSDRWGVAHCLIHLTRTNEPYRQVLAPALENARTGNVVASAPLKGGWFGRWFTGAVGPSVRLRVKAPGAVRPKPAAVQSGSIQAFLAEQMRTRALVEDARGLDLDAIRVVSPLSSWVKFRAGDALRIVVEHEKRHVKQAAAVLAHPAFPA
jgi:hypothetical protein